MPSTKSLPAGLPLRPASQQGAVPAGCPEGSQLNRTFSCDCSSISAFSMPSNPESFLKHIQKHQKGTYCTTSRQFSYLLLHVRA
uniref:Uncharacterized protein n=1 Tax=Apteryx owenii TaxID=8824 RepID=A0A8B9S2E7_APTOW